MFIELQRIDQATVQAAEANLVPKQTSALLVWKSYGFECNDHTHGHVTNGTVLYVKYVYPLWLFNGDSTN